MLKFGIFCIIIAVANAASSTSTHTAQSKDGSSASAGATASETVGTRSGGADGPELRDTTNNNANGGEEFPYQTFVPNFIDDMEEYQRAYNEYLADAKNYHARAYTSTYASPNAYAYATSSLVPDEHNIQRQILEHQQYLLNLQAQAQAQHNAFTQQIQQQIAQNMVLSQGAPTYTGASAAFGTNGGHQTTFGVPPNSAFPNVDTRFDGSDGGSSFAGGTTGGSTGGTAPNGFYGVSTSSFSQSTDVNGQKQQTGGSITTINDNGKITTHETRQ